MAGKSASLLTKTQRNRIQNDFAELDEAKKHRDKQRIRERIKSGFLDFQLLADYPDHQLALMFEDVPDDELRAALADTTILVERLREQSNIEREELIKEVRANVESYSNSTSDTRTLGRIDLRTRGEIRRQAENELTERFEPGRWDKRSNSLMRLGIGASILVIVGNLLYPTESTGLVQPILRPLLSAAVLILLISAIGWILIKGAQALKYSVLPFLAALSNDPKRAMRGTLTKLVENPWATIQESWNDL
ncbi:hypothetical protein [Halococcus sp. IIIV-5B]|uniref:hypothetical protein n=1 Tax=Halococcus sp. IIIV-5B TaxID=2321230 RepID=UPI000E74B628|nr:hypothetical protein [Halococcus sp. IIIV-5B]RJT07438.1 hypothetical protein D3261_02160 [Halococcus sp. IIIV-5B]